VNRVLLDVGPDHFARLEAVKMFTPVNASREHWRADWSHRGAPFNATAESDATHSWTCGVP